MRSTFKLMCVLVSVIISVSACGGSSPKPTPPTATTATSSPSEGAAPASTTPATLPAVDPPALKLRLVNVVTGTNSDLPVGFGSSRAWSPDSTRIAVTGQDDGLSLGDLKGQSFTRLWAGSCFGADWSPTQDQIAAACADGLIVLGTDGKVIARDQAVRAQWVYWARDGKTLAYGSHNDAISVLKSDGSRKTIPGTFISAQWLADGRLATVEQPDYRSAATIRVYDPAKDYVVIAETVTRANAFGLVIDHQGRYAAYSVFGPAVSNGGSRILPSTLYVILISDGQELETFPAYASSYGPVDFSPDGHSVLMQSDACGPSWSLAVGGLDGSTRTIAIGSFMVTKFSPDGSQVAYTRGTELWVVPSVVGSDGSIAARRLAEGVHGPAGFEWSPDGKWISVPPFFGGFDQCP